MSCGIYKIENLINHKIYIGQSIQIQHRLQKHKCAKDNFYIHRAIQKYGKENFSYDIIEKCEPNELDEKECYWIKYYNSLIPNGYNMVDGGNNGAGLAKGQEVEQYYLSGEYIQTFPSANQAGEKLNINISNITSCCNGERVQAGPFQWKWKNSEKEIKPIKGQYYNDPILKFDLKGNFLQEYSSLLQASQQNNISKSSISEVCKENRKSAGGFQWKYKSSNKKITKIKRIVLQLSLNGDIINSFSSCSEAHRKTGISLSNINACCNKKRPTAGNYKWTYE